MENYVHKTASKSCVKQEIGVESQNLNECSCCTNIVKQIEEVSVPIKINTTARVGEFITECVGEAKVTICQKGVSCGCEILITQTICTRIPIDYCTLGDIGETVVECKKSLCK